MPRHLQAVPDAEVPTDDDTVDDTVDDQGEAASHTSRIPEGGAGHGGGGGRQRTRRVKPRLRAATRPLRRNPIDKALWAVGPALILVGAASYLLSLADLRYLVAVGGLWLTAQAINWWGLAGVNPIVKGAFVVTLLAAATVAYRPAVGQRAWDAAATLLRGDQATTAPTPMVPPAAEADPAPPTTTP